MFGSAIYSSTHSSSKCLHDSRKGHGLTPSAEADRYARNHHIKSQIHVLLVCAAVTTGAVTLYKHDHQFHELQGTIYGVVSLPSSCDADSLRIEG